MTLSLIRGSVVGGALTLAAFACETEDPKDANAGFFSTGKACQRDWACCNGDIRYEVRCVDGIAYCKQGAVWYLLDSDPKCNLPPPTHPCVDGGRCCSVDTVRDVACVKGFARCGSNERYLTEAECRKEFPPPDASTDAPLDADAND